ncbi:MAG: hypothetical protein HOQ22_08965 [Nocardioidaceae bacterium]|nr:hypothetical protein [Nocardioidaceae bacterium]NUS51150.1 hypothetical protein [Nocardioidaceae bacterium]
MAGKSLLCRVGIHRWEDRRNDDGEAYRLCLRCGAEGDKIHLADYGDTGGGSMG